MNNPLIRQQDSFKFINYENEHHVCMKTVLIHTEVIGDISSWKKPMATRHELFIKTRTILRVGPRSVGLCEESRLVLTRCFTSNVTFEPLEYLPMLKHLQRCCFIHGIEIYPLMNLDNHFVNTSSWECIWFI